MQAHRSGVRGSTVLAFALMICARAAGAQYGMWAGDSLLAAGRLAAAESAYYDATRVRPRDPVARAALGRYLAARGATKVGAVLIEEARFFGGDSVKLAHSLVPMYSRLADFQSLATLQPNVLTPSERRRALWLADRPTQASLRDSIIVLSYRPIADGRGFGTVLLRLGTTELPAVIDPRVSGLALPLVTRSQLRTFGIERGQTIAVADAPRLGGITFSNVPATVGGPDDPIRIGLDVLSPYSPTFDPRKGLILLRRPNRLAPPVPGVRVPVLFDDNGVRLLLGGRWLPTSLAMPALLLSTRAWMWDGKRGEIVLLEQ